MVSLSDHQLQIIMATAADIDPERRDLYLQRVGAMLRMRHKFTNGDVADVASLAASGLVQQHTDAA
jgi:hypothetical protein